MIGFLLFQLDRVRQANTATPFAGVWDQRIEVISFAMLPTNIVTLAAPTAAAVVAAHLVTEPPGPWLATLLRTVGGLAIALIAVGVLSIFSIVVNDPGPTQYDLIVLRVGGISMAAGFAWLTQAAIRRSS
jgi:hypothetical protein